jgi:hypothetical protein
MSLGGLVLDGALVAVRGACPRLGTVWRDRRSCNIPVYAGGMWIAPDADLADGLAQQAPDSECRACLPGDVVVGPQVWSHRRAGNRTLGIGALGALLADGRDSTHLPNTGR